MFCFAVMRSPTGADRMADRRRKEWIETLQIEF
jgi:hypothetical protein